MLASLARFPTKQFLTRSFSSLVGYERPDTFIEPKRAANLVADGAEDGSTVLVDCSPTRAYMRARLVLWLQHANWALPLGVSPFLKQKGSAHVHDAQSVAFLCREILAIAKDSRVIVYDGDGGTLSARFWWMMRLYGFENVQVMTGGWEEYFRESLPMSIVANQPSDAARERAIERPFQPVQQDGWLASAEETLEAARSGKATVLDVRTRAEWEGLDTKNNKRVGHIPGATWLDHSMMSEKGAPLSATKLKERLHEAGVDESRPVITYCQGGIRAAQAALMLHALGVPSVANFDGSMAYYANETDLPLREEG